VAHIPPEQLSAYLDGELSEEERRRVEVHLGTCGVCRADVEELRWVVGLVRALPEVEVPRPFYVRRADLAPAHASPGLAARLAGLFRALSYAGGVVTLLLAVVTAFSALSGQGPEAELVTAPEERVEVAEAPAADMRTFEVSGPSAPPQEDGELVEEATVDEGAAELGAEVMVTATPPASVAAADEKVAATPSPAPADERAVAALAPTPSPAAATPPAREDRAARGDGGLLALPLTGWLAVAFLSTLLFGGLARWLDAR